MEKPEGISFLFLTKLVVWIWMPDSMRRVSFLLALENLSRYSLPEMS